MPYWKARSFDQNQNLVSEIDYEQINEAIEDARVFLEATPVEVKLSTLVSAEAYQLEKRGFAPFVQFYKINC